jgi:hypothetical protein
LTRWCNREGKGEETPWNSKEKDTLTIGRTLSKGTTGTKVDLKKQQADLYHPCAKEVTVVEVPSMPFLMIDGAGNPNTSQEYQQAVEGLYAVAYALKFLLKKEQGIDYAVMPLEGLWWAPDMRDFSVEHKETWRWTMMIAQPQEGYSHWIWWIIRPDLTKPTSGRFLVMRQSRQAISSRSEAVSECFNWHLHRSPRVMIQHPTWLRWLSSANRRQGA